MASTVREDEVTSEDELFDQSEVAADYIEGLLDIIDLDGDIDELVVGDRPQVEVVGDGLGDLIGPKGATLEALQELSRLAIYRKTGEHSRLMVDIGGFRAKRRDKLSGVARRTVEKVLDTGRPVKLEPMSAFERKAVHDVINATDGVESESEGAEPRRRVVVRPA
ncbi:Jag family protein [Salininema proteolyticum]|uniref:Protein jag n=1 Tax=Salininema proteolyticum TaxID=1607685 RepID=A0ABV8TTS3_9ACTN